MSSVLRLHNRHTGEVLELQRRRLDGELILQINGSLPPGAVGPPLHLHLYEDEEGHVVSGTIAAIVGDKQVSAKAGEWIALPRGIPHRWWNGGDDGLRFEGYARPVVDLDRFLQAAFEVANASPNGRPSLFYMAHLVKRHWRTQRLATPFPALMRAFFTVVVAVGAVFGKYRGRDWPGAPERNQGAPLV